MLFSESIIQGLCFCCIHDIIHVRYIKHTQAYLIVHNGIEKIQCHVNTIAKDIA